MIKYAKVPSKDGAGDRFTHNGLFIKESRVPPELMEKFEYATELEYDEHPEKRRCIFDEAYQSRQRFLNSELIDLCEWHYQHARLGEIAHQVDLLAKEAKVKAEKVPKKTNKKRTKKTALSSMIT